MLPVLLDTGGNPFVGFALGLALFLLLAILAGAVILGALRLLRASPGSAHLPFLALGGVLLAVGAALMARDLTRGLLSMGQNEEAAFVVFALAAALLAGAVWDAVRRDG